MTRILSYFSIALLIYAANCEFSSKCKPKNDGYQSCLRSWYNYGVKKNEVQKLFKDRVNKCFEIVKCNKVNFEGTILPAVKKNTMDRLDSTNTGRNSCVRRQMHITQKTLLSQCTQENTGKDAEDVNNVNENLQERTKYFLYTLSIENAREKCPTVNPVCIKEAYQMITKDWCAVFKDRCSRTLTPDPKDQQCKGERKTFRDEVCKCRDDVSRKRATRRNSLLGTGGTLTSGANNNILGNLANRLGLGQLIPALRFKRQAKPNIGSLITTLVSALPKVPLRSSEPDLDELGKEYGLNSNEVNETMAKCGVRSYEFPDTPEKQLLLACNCDVAATPDKRNRCLSSGQCIGKNYQMYVKAERLFKENMNNDHLRFFCECGEQDPIPTGLIG